MFRSRINCRRPGLRSSGIAAGGNTWNSRRSTLTGTWAETKRGSQAGNHVRPRVVDQAAGAVRRRPPPVLLLLVSWDSARCWGIRLPMRTVGRCCPVCHGHGPAGGRGDPGFDAGSWHAARADRSRQLGADSGLPFFGQVRIRSAFRAVRDSVARAVRDDRRVCDSLYASRGGF